MVDDQHESGQTRKRPVIGYASLVPRIGYGKHQKKNAINPYCLWHYGTAPEGFEPPTLGSEDNFPHFVITSQGNDLWQVKSSVVPSAVPLPTGPDKSAESVDQLHHPTLI